MPSSFFKHPGFLGWTSQGVILIHADWPAYATEHGIGYSLMSLGQFPLGTKFTPIDDIDQCYLFIVGDRPVQGDPFSDSHFHVALWHEDLQALAEASYVTGASAISHSEWVKRRNEELRGLVWRRPDGTFAQVPLVEPEDDDGWPQKEIPIVENELSLTTAGAEKLEGLLSAERNEIDEEIMRRARPAILAGLFDSAIREACVVVESGMRTSLNTAAFGSKLVDEFFGRAIESDRAITAHLKTFRTEVRTAFRFVRNEYAHNVHVITQTQCYAILARISNVFVGVKAIARIIQSNDKRLD